MKKDFNDFAEIIKKLRAPGGCPWDREQTHKSLAKHLLEEAYEAYDAIMEGDSSHTMEELGDVLLQVVMHAEIAAESGEYTMTDITDAAAQKMIVRHPHVFSDVKAENSEQVLDNWEQIKRRERGQKKLSESLDGITLSLPSLSRGVKIIEKVKKNDKDFFEDKRKYLRGDIALDGEAIGECLFEVCLEAQRKGIDPEAELFNFLKKFIKKIKNIEENT